MMGDPGFHRFGDEGDVVQDKGYRQFVGMEQVHYSLRTWHLRELIRNRGHPYFVRKHFWSLALVVR